MALKAIKSSPKMQGMVAIGAAATMLIGILSAPTLALAATDIHITQKASEGDNPASTITVTVPEGAAAIDPIEYPGGDAEIDPISVDTTGVYTINATAEGYTFDPVEVDVTDADSEEGYTAELEAVPDGGGDESTQVRVEVQFKIDGVTDYSGIVVNIYEGTDVSGDPYVADESVEADGLFIFEIEPGTYTLQYVYPDDAAYDGLPDTQTIDVLADSGTIYVDAPGASTGGGDDEGDDNPGGEEPGDTTPAGQNLLIIKALDADMAPISGITFAIWAGETLDGNPLLEDLVTDSEGMVSVPGIPDGTYTVAATNIPDGYTNPLPQMVSFGEGENPEQTLDFSFRSSIQEVPADTPSDNTGSMNNGTGSGNLAHTADSLAAYAGLMVIIAGSIAAAGLSVVRRRNQR